MLMNRIVGAFMLRRSVWADVEKDPSFTTTAWGIVVVVSLLNQLGIRAIPGIGLGEWLIAALVGTLLQVLGFAVAAWIIYGVGMTVFDAEVTFDEMVRTLGLAYVWNIVGFIGILALLSGALVCILSPVTFIAWILGLIAWLVAAKEALDLSWGKTILTVVLGWIIVVVMSFVTNLILGMLNVGGVLEMRLNQ